MTFLITNIKDVLFSLSIKGNIFKYDASYEIFSQIKEHESNINDIIIIYPKGDSIVTLSQNSEVTLWKTSDGKMVRFYFVT